MTSPQPAASRRPALVIALAILGVVLLVVGIVYFAKSANDLPSFFPGHQAGSAHKHVKHGIGALVVALICFIGAWFSLGSRPSDSTP
jgi:amino acid permease